MEEWKKAEQKTAWGNLSKWEGFCLMQWTFLLLSCIPISYSFVHIQSCHEFLPQWEPSFYCDPLPSNCDKVLHSYAYRIN
jgi:hypothetical protein